MRTYLVISFLLLPWIGYAQRSTDFYKSPTDRGSFMALRAGINYSQTSVVAYPSGQLAGIKPFAGFYIGALFQKNLLTNLVYRIDGNVQVKGLRVATASGNIGIRAKYYYAGVTPQLGINLMRQLTVYAGPELNVLLAKSDAIGKGYPVEAGPTVRLSYSFQKVGAEISYFRSFTKYDVLGDGASAIPNFRNDFYNRNLQVGLIYRFN